MTDQTFSTTLDELENGPLWDSVFAGDVEQTVEVLFRLRDRSQLEEVTFNASASLRRVGTTPEFLALVLSEFNRRVELEHTED
ncbi:hypothetical protein C4561_02330 [candidate division WWE3 bacterium]|jgi:hypothetical protein|uniref:Uncharacterized protein n=1 Tax=candidate division WWE3 bacterium TaxID=2053526 RepID=A0A3A4ZKH0_UNCKA|nr:MAG: hypothetical protein C4561_02330 [candidate division WWE3 bacterium]